MNNILSVEEVNVCIILGMRQLGYDIKEDQIKHELSFNSEGKSVYNGCIISIGLDNHINHDYPVNYGYSMTDHNAYAAYSQMMNPGLSLEQFSVKVHNKEEK